MWSHEDVLAGHARRYTLPALKYVLRKAGYTVEFATYFFAFLPLPILIRRALPYRLGFGSEESSEVAIRSEHQVQHPVLRRMLGVLTRWELSRIAIQRRLCFGASCLVVARRS